MDYLEKYRELIEVTLDRCYQMNDRHVEVDREIEVSDRLAFDRGRDQYLWFRFGWLGKQKIQCFVVYICIKNNKVWVEEDSTDLASRREAPRSTASVSVGMKAERIDDCSRAT
jgi:XisI protein